MVAVRAMYVRFSKGKFRKTDALSAQKYGFFTLPFDVICLKNGSFWGGQLPFKSQKQRLNLCLFQVGFPSGPDSRNEC